MTHFDYAGFAESLTKEKKAASTYYVGEIRQYPNNKKSEILYANQQKLFTNLRNQDVTIKMGYLLMSDGVFHEKGVDVQIAVDIVRGAIKNVYDTFFLISSDTDLLPAIQTAKDEGKKVIYVGFENYVSRALLKNCSSSIIVKKSQILQFAPKK